MALWMDTESEPKTESEKADLDAIAALKESAAIELKVLISLCHFFKHLLGAAYFILS